MHSVPEKLQKSVYSNQPSVTLFLNGEEVEELTADKVFVFTVLEKMALTSLLHRQEI